MGEAIATRIDELMPTGKLEFLEKLKQEVPSTMAERMRVPGLGPKKVAMILAGIATLSRRQPRERVTQRVTDLHGRH